MSNKQSDLNNLQVETINIVPATIEFNHEALEQELEISLKKYTGLTFTEDDATECRRTIAELRKGKQAVDRYRIDTKNKLNEPVIEFENKCKELNQKFDSVINPLVAQNDDFEVTRKNTKYAEVLVILDEIIESFELDHARADELQIIDSYLTKSKSIKSITDELESQASHLKLQQDKEKADKDMVSTTVKLANSEHDLNLSESAYISLLEFQDVERVKDQIEYDAKTEVDKRIAKEEYLKRIKEQDAARKKMQEEKEELQRLEQEAEQKRQAEAQELQRLVEQKLAENAADPFVLDPLPTKNEAIIIEDIEPDPFTDSIDDPFSEELPAEPIKIFTETLKITGSESQLSALEAYMKAEEIEWVVLSDE